ncbi:hypothetical protein CKK33_18640 [Mucilaginibacter sp. MD40]|uniref:DUF6088 family protein n=1 Tax=Mucilaginibacter sp. MD40 TaxID=2029590 RepID=UPI000BAC6D78|nr:DUF6088 family protein [Mucilaginibacter sp. MD40]PAW95408.1 hypothetical protein CKK33_18640 [Mucilaginibacter sp. MD40]
MAKLDELKKHLKRGKVYRRTDLVEWSKSVDRHLDILTKDGTLQKLSQGVYYFPKESAFGKTPPKEEDLVRTFLKDDRFLLTSPNAYNSLGVGATQLYNKRVVYNHKRHGEFKLGNRKFDFQIKHHFPEKLTEEFLLVDMVNNLDKVAEDQDCLLKNIMSKAFSMNRKKLQQSLVAYGNAKAKKMLSSILAPNMLNDYAG